MHLTVGQIKDTRSLFRMWFQRYNMTRLRGTSIKIDLAAIVYSCASLSLRNICQWFGKWVACWREEILVTDSRYFYVVGAPAPVAAKQATHREKKRQRNLQEMLGEYRWLSGKRSGPREWHLGWHRGATRTENVSRALLPRLVDGAKDFHWASPSTSSKVVSV